MADYTITEYAILAAGVGVSFLIAFNPYGWANKAGKTVRWVFVKVLWVALAVISVGALLGLTVYMSGSPATTPSWNPGGRDF